MPLPSWRSFNFGIGLSIFPREPLVKVPVVLSTGRALLLSDIANPADSSRTRIIATKTPMAEFRGAQSGALNLCWWYSDCMVCNVISWPCIYKKWRKTVENDRVCFRQKTQAAGGPYVDILVNVVTRWQRVRFGSSRRSFCFGFSVSLGACVFHVWDNVKDITACDDLTVTA